METISRASERTNPDPGVLEMLLELDEPGPGLRQFLESIILGLPFHPSM
jgi:hypothetical protein